ncbi:hypothetical protein [Streptomyces europaeiscabiei]|uniref:hypothetical protein n=1 Tax=Streptomyces europaeiscabiei TaxID=146819 RepID=UPI0029C0D2F1|nr:hypothetical protein [Streptomyces europaeiscabiei]
MPPATITVRLRQFRKEIRAPSTATVPPLPYAVTAAPYRSPFANSAPKDAYRPDRVPVAASPWVPSRLMSPLCRPGSG